MHPERSTSSLMFALAVLALPAPALAQGPQVLLRYRPKVGSGIVMQSDVTMSQRMVAGPADTVNTSAKIAMRVSRRVVRAEDGKHRVRVSVDSAHGTMDIAGTHRDVPPQPARFVEMMVDSLAVVTLPTDQPVHTADSLRRFNTWQTQPYEDLAFPLAPVQRRSRWTASKTYDVGDVGLSGLPPGVTIPPLREQLDIWVDSIVPRAADTLVFIGLNGRVDPVTIPISAAGVTLTITLKGVESATQIWSTGWQGWVGAGGHGRFDFAFKGTDKDGKPQSANMVMEVIQSGRMGR